MSLKKGYDKLREWLVKHNKERKYKKLKLGEMKVVDAFTLSGSK